MSTGLIEMSYKRSFPANRRPTSLLVLCFLWKQGGFSLLSGNLCKAGDSKDPSFIPQRHPAWKPVWKAPVKDRWKSERKALGSEERKPSGRCGEEEEGEGRGRGRGGEKGGLKQKDRRQGLHWSGLKGKGGASVKKEKPRRR